MSGFADELFRRISDAREALRLAKDAGEFYAVRVYTGELDSLFRLANENDVPIPAEPNSATEPVPADKD